MPYSFFGFIYYSSSRSVLCATAVFRWPARQSAFLQPDFLRLDFLDESGVAFPFIPFVRSMDASRPFIFGNPFHAQL